MLEKSEYPNKKIHKRVHDVRKIGLGVMGLADMFILCKMPYTSNDALELAEDCIQAVLDSSVEATHELGQKEGTFPKFNDYQMPHHIKDALTRVNIPPHEYTPRNAALLTIAPTGTISMLAGTSSGIEPVFYFEQEEARMDSRDTYKHPLYKEFKEKFPRVGLPSYFQDSTGVDVDSHIQMQATFQRYICSAVSKTVNLPSDATKEDVEKVYKQAFVLNCKGVTIYRDGSLENQVISGTDKVQSISHVEPEARPKVLSGQTYEINTGFGKMLITINYNGIKPFEIICQLGKSGASEAAKAEAIGRLCSLAMRCGIHVKDIIEQIEGIVGNEAVYTEYGLVKSIPDAISKILANHVLDEPDIPITMVSMSKCPEPGCGGTKFHKEGSCLVCESCGWKSCGG